jgi:predicted nucleotidyltransferase
MPDEGDYVAFVKSLPMSYDGDQTAKAWHEYQVKMGWGLCGDEVRDARNVGVDEDTLLRGAEQYNKRLVTLDCELDRALSEPVDVMENASKELERSKKLIEESNNLLSGGHWAKGREESLEDFQHRVLGLLHEGSKLLGSKKELTVGRWDPLKQEWSTKVDSAIVVERKPGDLAAKNDSGLTAGRWDPEKREWVDGIAEDEEDSGSGLTVGRWDDQKKKWVK